MTEPGKCGCAGCRLKRGMVWACGEFFAATTYEAAFLYATGSASDLARTNDEISNEISRLMAVCLKARLDEILDSADAKHAAEKDRISDVLHWWEWHTVPTLRDSDSEPFQLWEAAE